MFKFLLISASLFVSQFTFAWGGRGHDTICETATYLVKNQNLKSFLTSRPHTMGHLCNIPDIYWKSLGKEVSELGDATHFIDVEVLGLSIDKIPADYSEIVKNFTGANNAFKEGKIFSIPRDFGSVWWRANQFVQLISFLKPTNNEFKMPQNKKEEQDDKLPYNDSIYKMMVYMGLMGHYVGDNAQPLHTTADYDGYQAGHGGLHSYYEEAVVSEFDGDLGQLILIESKKINIKKARFLNGVNPIENMRELTILSFNDLPKLFKLDPIIKKSEVITDKGMQIRKVAERKSPKEGLKKFKPLILSNMARASLLLAKFWDQAYTQMGAPDLSGYKNYKYPFTPEFVPPDYIPVEKK